MLTQQDALQHAERVHRIAAAKTNDFMELVRLAGLDPAVHFRFADWSGVDFSDCNLRGFDFTGARLHGCKFDGALIVPGLDIDQRPAVAARFDLAELGAVSHDREPGSHAPAIMTPIANLKTAADWADFEAGWTKAERAPAREHLSPGAIFTDAAFSAEMVVVPAGTFTMGSPDDEFDRIGKEHELAKNGALGAEEPRREVTIARPFAVGRHAVTRGQFAAFVTATDRKMPDRMWTYEREGEKWEPKERSGRSWRNPGFAQEDDHPVVGVSWDDAKAYCSWLSKETQKAYRLLSEAEWEYVARAGSQTAFWWGDTIAPTQANYNGTVAYAGGAKGEWRKATFPVGAFEANPWGLYNVHGNVFEWCEDVFHDSYHRAPTDGGPWLDGGEAGRRVVRGGSWLSFPQVLRSACRDWLSTDGRNYNLGFRLARTLHP